MPTCLLCAAPRSQRTTCDTCETKLVMANPYEHNAREELRAATLKLAYIAKVTQFSFEQDMTSRSYQNSTIQIIAVSGTLAQPGRYALRSCGLLMNQDFPTAHALNKYLSNVIEGIEATRLAKVA